MNEIVNIENKIYIIRGKRVMLDSDLAQLYGVTTKDPLKLNHGSSIFANERKVRPFVSLTNTQRQQVLNDITSNHNIAFRDLTIEEIEALLQRRLQKIDG